MSRPIPQPPSLPFVGNLRDVDASNLMKSFVTLADKYGEILKLNVLGRQIYIVSSERLATELCDEQRFEKGMGAAILQARNGSGDGLFTAYTGSEEWATAHRTLLPSFGPLKIADMYEEMYDIATQMVEKWARQGPEETINLSEDFTRLTLDSIALCSMATRFNSFYHDEMHPFVVAMTDFLLESGKRNNRTKIETMLNPGLEKKYRQDIKTMRDLAGQVLAERRKNPCDKKDLLNAMVLGRDPKTGERLNDTLIMDNMLTFLVAGHETTSGMLSFATYFLLKNPSTLQKAKQEVDQVCAKGPIKIQHMSKLPYLEAVLRETLRLCPSAPIIARKQIDDKSPTILGGEYTIPPGSVFLLLLPKIQTDSAVYGEAAAEFRPERLLNDATSTFPAAAWKPFGTGARSCIGRPFAWQEGLLALALMLQNFNIRMADPSYELQIKQTLTIKPDGFNIKAALREGIDVTGFGRRIFSDAAVNSTNGVVVARPGQQGTAPFSVLYGGNSGTCEGLAQALAGRAAQHGFAATVKPLDAAVEAFPVDHPVAIIASSYEGLPPDNAATFFAWLQRASDAQFQNAQIAVFGCGHKDWAATYQKIPTAIENALLARGATKLIDRGETNVQTGTVFDDFDAWCDKLWAATRTSKDDDAEGFDMEMTTSTRATHLRHFVQEAIITKNILLTPPGVPEKRHIELKLPSEMNYEAGDYLAVLPLNIAPMIGRVLRKFHIPWDAVVTIAPGTATTIPTGKELAIMTVLSSYVELGAPASKRNIATLIKYSGKEVKAESRSSVMDILEANPDIDLPFSVYLSMLPAMRLRQYSISSSPLTKENHASITYSVAGETGVTTNYLRLAQPGLTIQVAVKKSPPSFSLPKSDKTPIIMACAGTGLAPMLGFLEERAAKHAAGKTLGPAALFIGCRHPDQDKIFAERLEEWQRQGVVEVYYAFSQASEQSAGCKYAQDRLAKEWPRMKELALQGAKGYICGSSRLGEGVANVMAKVLVEVEATKCNRITPEQGQEMWKALRGERYAVDVFD